MGEDRHEDLPDASGWTNGTYAMLTKVVVVERWEYLILPKKTNRSMNEFAEIKG
jgi:hypothetical protein